jgi:hypothetical protein
LLDLCSTGANFRACLFLRTEIVCVLFDLVDYLVVVDLLELVNTRWCITVVLVVFFFRMNCVYLSSNLSGMYFLPNTYMC